MTILRPGILQPAVLQFRQERRSKGAPRTITIFVPRRADRLTRLSSKGMGVGHVVPVAQAFDRTCLGIAA